MESREIEKVGVKILFEEWVLIEKKERSTFVVRGNLRHEGLVRTWAEGKKRVAQGQLTVASFYYHLGFEEKVSESLTTGKKRINGNFVSWSEQEEW